MSRDPRLVPHPVRDFLARDHPEALELALWVRDKVLQAEPELEERVYLRWDGVGFRHPEAGYVCAIYPHGPTVRLLFEHGHRLPDPEGLFDGGGKQTRYITITAPDDRLAAAIPLYVQESIVERVMRGR
jgi:hypothetical protein